MHPQKILPFRIQSLNGDWQLRQLGTDEWLQGTVPGGVHTDLLNLGKITDPFVSDHELRVMWVAETDWEYRRTFTADPELLAELNIYLVCEGLDTIADIYLNQTYLGHAENMFRRWEWPVKGILRAGENEIRVVFSSPVNFITAKQAQLSLTGGGDIPGGPHLRKAPCHWGWDWGPKLPSIGIWKDIHLDGFAARFSNVHLHQYLETGSAKISADVWADKWFESSIHANLVVTTPGGEVLQDQAELLWGVPDLPGCFMNLSVEIPNPHLWWPNGYGEQPLYQVEVLLTKEKMILDRRVYHLGLRTLELRQEPDQWGKEFTFYINGVRLFAKGANWIPSDSFPTRITKASLGSLLDHARDAHMNMLRVWGGGYYPDDEFYNLCDRYGILLWQDFMFACGIYPADSEFFENVRCEVIENVRRLRHHACLALWCGNNEMEQGWCEWGWNDPDDPINQRLKDGYDRMFHHLLPELLEREDPFHPYWPSSASANTPFTGANNQAQGDCHYWEVWHGRQPFTAYRAQFPRFMSEFGFQALPPLKTIATYADPAEWNITSYAMEHHQRSGTGNVLIVAQMINAFQMPKDFASLIYLSQVLQAEGIRYGVEHWRRNRNRVSGTLYWQLNDCWPVASWSSIDYFGRWKALHYAAKRFYAPLLLSVADQGSVVQVHLTNDLTAPQETLVRWRLETLTGRTLQDGEQITHALSLADTLVASLDFSATVNAENQRDLVFICELWQEGILNTYCVTPLVANKHLKLRDPHLQVNARIQGGTLWVDTTAQTLARFVELSLDGADVIFSDNYFDIPAGATVTVNCPLPSNVEPVIRVRSLYDSY